MATFICAGCQERKGARFDQCPRCRSWGTCVRAPEGVARSVIPGSVRALSAAKPFEPPRLKVSSEWDTAFGGGLALTSTVAMWGKPGAGKTTELLRIMSIVGGVYVETEWLDPDGGMLRRTADNAGIDCSRISFASAESPEDAARVIRSSKWTMVVVDSINGFDHDGSGGMRLMKRASTLQLQAAADIGATLFCVLHATRDGEMSGPQWLAHKFNTVIGLSHASIRVVKNQFGPMPIRVKRPKRRAPLALVAS